MATILAPESGEMEAGRLRRSLNDLVALLALSASWSGREPGDVATTLADALFSMLKLDLVLVEAGNENLDERETIVRVAPILGAADTVKAELYGAVGRNDLAGSPSMVQIQGQPVVLFIMQLGLARPLGLLIVGSTRGDFPSSAERLILSVAANQAALALQDSRLLEEERQRAAQLDRAVAERTRVLAETNSALESEVAERRRVEEALRASELSATSLIEGLPGFVAVLGPDGRVERVNHQILDYCGQSLEELRDWGSNGTVHPEDLPHVAEVFGSSIATGVPYQIEQRLRRHDGAYRWFDNRGLPVRDDQGQVIAWHVLLTDIDDGRRAEDAVRSSELKLRRLTETIPQNLFGADANGSVNYLNSRMRDWFGRADDTIMAEEWIHLVHPDDRDPTVEAWFTAVESGTPYHRQVRFIHCSGQYRWCEIQAQPLRGSDGSTLAWHGVVNDVHDRKLAEDALKASEEQLRLTIDTIPALAWSAHPDGTADFFNRSYLEFVGRSRESLDGWEWTSIFHPDDLAIAERAWDHCRTTGEGVDIEARLRRRDGVFRWFRFQANPLRDESGKVLKWFGVNTDIEDRKQAEVELEARARRLREAHDHLSQAQRLSQTGSFTTDVQSDTHVWSDELYRILEYERDVTPTFRAFRERIHPDDLAAFDAGFKRSMADRSDFDEIFKIVTPKGNTKYLHAVAQFEPGSMERPIVLGSIQDITDRRHAEDELRRSEYLLTTSERISETGSFIWDLVADKVVFSEQMRRIYEIPDDYDIVRPDLRSIIHPDDRALVDEKVARVFRGEACPENEERLLMADGRVKWVNTAFRVVEHDDGRKECFGIAQDVTRRRLTENALDQLRTELAHVTRVMSLGEMAASIAHEVNQPLAGIVTNASTCLRMLSSEPPNIEGARQTAERSLRDGNRASAVIARLRSLYLKRRMTFEPVDLSDAAQEVIAICSHDLQRRRILLKSDLERLPPVMGDRIQLQQVILNLILNAADAICAQQGRREILVETADEDGQMARLSVRDTGPGFPAEEAARLFDAFHSTKPDGLGIGLSISKSIIEQHDGDLTAALNEGEAGATFSYSVPYAPAPARERSLEAES